MQVVSLASGGGLGLVELSLDVLLDGSDRWNCDSERAISLLNRLLGGVATLFDNLGEVGNTAAVPGKDVLGVAGDVRESTDGTDLDQVGLELLGGDVGNSVCRILGWLKRQEVGQETSNMGRGHGCSRDGVGGVIRSNPGREDVETRGKDVVALAEVGEVGTLIGKGGGTDGDSVGSGSRRVVAGVGVVVTSSDGEVDTSIDGSVDSEVESDRLATAQAHVGGRALEALLLSILGGDDGVGVSLGSPLNTLHDIGHGAGAVGTEHLDGVDISLLGNTVLLASNSAGAVSAVAVAILVSIAAGDGLAPVGAALEVNMLDVGSSVDDINVNALTAIGRVEVLVVGTEAQGVAVRDTGKSPRGVLLRLVVVLVSKCVDLGILLDVVDLVTLVSVLFLWYLDVRMRIAVTCELRAMAWPLALSPQATPPSSRRCEQ